MEIIEVSHLLGEWGADYILRHSHGSLEAATRRYNQPGILDIDHVATHTEFRGRGVAKTLLRTAVTIIPPLEQQQIETVHLSLINPKMVGVLDAVFGSATQYYAEASERSARVNRLDTATAFDLCSERTNAAQEYVNQNQELPDDLDPGISAQIDIADIDFSRWQMPLFIIRPQSKLL
ncbi:hypothetical protein KC960_04475 [Candidatus Saccharibacteria bacterium]|nr:hypothetical protein [Candidatus Saccharibacteria bacterium]